MSESQNSKILKKRWRAPRLKKIAPEKKSSPFHPDHGERYAAELAKKGGGVKRNGAAVKADELDTLGLWLLRHKNVERQAVWDPEGKIDLVFRGLELGGEAGEALNAVKKLERAKRGIPGSRVTVDALAEELADVVICADLIGMEAGIDLAKAVREKFNKRSREMGFNVFIGGGR